MNQLIIVLIIFGFGCLLGWFINWLNSYWSKNENNLVNKINNILPQTQCGQCGFPGCMPYAKAIVSEKVDITKCLPGGVFVVKKIEKLTGIIAQSKVKEIEPNLVYIEEDLCIGCTKCIQICPVNAIIGGIKKMHTIIYDECTGCNLCIPACPKDCIIKIPVSDKRAKNSATITKYDNKIISST